MDDFKKSIDNGIRRIRGKIELVKKPHVSVKEWLETNISMSIISSKTGSGEKCSSTTSGPSSCSASDSVHVVKSIDMPSKPSRFMAMNVELQDIFEDDDGKRMTEVLEKGLDPNFIDLNGKPLVYRAVEEQKYCILDTMLEFGFGCDVNSTCHNEINGGWTALHLACHLGDLRAVEILLGVTDGQMLRLDCCDVGAVDIDGRTPLHVLTASSTWYYQRPCNHGDTGGETSDQTATCDMGCAYNHLGVLHNGPGSVYRGPGIQPRLAGESSDSLDEGGEEGIGFSLQSQLDEHENGALLSRVLAGEENACNSLNNNPAHRKTATQTDTGSPDINTGSNNLPQKAANHIPDTDTHNSHQKHAGRTLVSQSQKICHQTNHYLSGGGGGGVTADRRAHRHHTTNTKHNHHSPGTKLESDLSQVNEDPLAVTPHGKVMKILLKAGCNANRVDEYNGTPLHICALRGNLEGVSILLEHGADYDLVDNMCETALVKAILHHRSSVVRRLLLYQSHLPDMKRLELSELIFTLIEDLSSREERQQEQEVLSIMVCLLEKGVHVNVTDSRGRTPLHLSVLYGCEQVSTQLIGTQGCMVDKEDEDGFTPLFLAAWNPKKVEQCVQLRLLELLLQRGADVNHHDVCKILPVNAALESGQYLSALLLIQHGCQVTSSRWFCYSVEMLRQNTSTLPFVERFVLSMINNYRHSPSLVDVAAILGKKELVRAILKAGLATVNLPVMQRWVANETQEFAVMDYLQGYVDFLQEMAAQVLSLKDQTRRVIRIALGPGLWYKTKSLPLPEILQAYINMEEIKL